VLRLLLRFRRSLSNKNEQTMLRRSQCPVLLGCFAETYAAISEKSQQQKLANRAAAVPVPGAAGSCLLRLLLRFRRSLSKTSAYSAAAVPVPGAAGICVLRLLLRFRRSLSNQIRKQCRGGRRARCCCDLFAETSAGISEKTQQQNQQTVPRRSPCPVLLGCFC